MSATGAERQRAVFLDIDGTYASHGVVPSPHADAVRAARANGHRVLLCTGRPLSMFPPGVLDAGFDGIVGGAGAWVRVGDEVLRDVRFPAELGQRATAALDAAGALYIAETPERPVVTPRAFQAISQRAAEAAERGLPHTRTLDDIVALLAVQESLADVRFTKLTVFWGTTPLTEIAAALGPDAAAYPSSIAEMGTGAGELYLAAVNKAEGMKVALTALGMTADDAIAFGDGPNDVEMLRFARVGVAMADGSQVALDAANEVVPGPDALGIVVGFERLGLI